MITISRSQLITEIVEILDARVYRPLDEQFLCPAPGWLRDFAKALPAHAPQFVSEAFDCDNFAIRAKAQADEALLRAKLANYGHTFGYVEVMMQPGMELNGITAPSKGTHACNICRDSTGVWWFVEPQTGILSPHFERPRGIVVANLWM